MYNNPEYEQLLEDIREISKMSSKDNSILFDFRYKDDEIKSYISLIDHSGTKEELKEVKFDVKNRFQSFITPLIKAFNESNEIVFNDFVDVNTDNLVTFRMITENNDQFTVDGLTFEDAYYLQDVTSDLKIKENDAPKVLVMNNRGAVNIWIILLSIVLLVVSIIIIVIQYL